jgi:Holliday junction resolvase RusA-like endonuclease
LKAFIEIPASWSKKKRAGAIDGSVLPVSRPDLDNYVKAALDGMNEVVFSDDSQIVHLIAIKSYDENPRLVITVQGQE